MKTETQTAEKKINKSKILMLTSPIPSLNVESFNTVKEGNKLLGEMKEHKTSCQRFLKFLDNYNFNELIVGKKDTEMLDNIQGKAFKEKITDLKQAIKLYNEAGI